MLDVQSNIDRLDKTIKYRDMLESIAVVIMVPFFLHMAFKTPFMLSKIACVLIILFGIFVVLRLKNARKHKPAPFTGTYLEYLHKTRGYLTVQKQLLDTALYWYIIPGYVGVTLFTLGTGLIPYIIKMQILGLTFSIVAYFLNKRAVTKTLTPRMTKIDELINLLEKS
jgi:hypothetical protein